MTIEFEACEREHLPLWDFGWLEATRYVLRAEYLPERPAEVLFELLRSRVYRNSFAEAESFKRDPGHIHGPFRVDKIESLLPYGPRFPIDPGDFFQPLGLPMLVGVFGPLISGWKTPPRYRVWLVVPAVMMLMIWTFTILWFWPHNVAIGTTDAIRDRTEIIRMARQWVHYDWLRVVIGVMAFVSTVRAISVPFLEPQNSAAPKPAPAK